MEIRVYDKCLNITEEELFYLTSVCIKITKNMEEAWGQYRKAAVLLADSEIEVVKKISQLW